MEDTDWITRHLLSSTLEKECTNELVAVIKKIWQDYGTPLIQAAVHNHSVPQMAPIQFVGSFWCEV